MSDLVALPKQPSAYVRRDGNDYIAIPEESWPGGDPVAYQFMPHPVPYSLIAAYYDARDRMNRARGAIEARGTMNIEYSVDE